MDPWNIPEQLDGTTKETRVVVANPLSYSPIDLYFIRAR